MKGELTAAVHAKITEASLAGWHAFADQHGTTVSALIEVVGLELGELAAGTAPDGDPARVERVAGPGSRALPSAETPPARERAPAAFLEAQRAASGAAR